MEEVNHCGRRKRAVKKILWPTEFTPRRRCIGDAGDDSYMEEEMYKILKNKIEEKDECALFGDYIAAKMRKLNDRQRAILQHEIHGLMLQAEMATFESVSGHSSP